MSSTEESSQNVAQLNLELYFLITKFLSSGQCQRAAKALREELAEHQLLPKRTDWNGQEHFRSFENLSDIHQHIRSDHLLKICQRIGPLLEKEVKPSVCGVASLLGAGRQSVLRTIEDVKYVKWGGAVHVGKHHGRPLQPPANLAHPPNLCTILDARRLSGVARRDHMVCTKMYHHMTQLSRALGHLSAVYCVAFDRTGEFIFTGADDHLVKIWSAVTGCLQATLRGHGAEITDMTVNYENTLIAAGSCDKFIRVWCLRTLSPVAVLHGHTGMITSLQFCPLVRNETRFLASTGGDGCVCFWKWCPETHEFDPKPAKFVERSRAGAQMLCSSFSSGGIFLATGSADQVVRVYNLAGAQMEKICELEAHVDRVDSIQYCNRGSRFVSGSRDGTARVWRYERQVWRALVLDTAIKLDGKPTDNVEDESKTKFKVTMVCWNADDSYVITAVNDCSLKVWDSYTGLLRQVLKGHEDEVFVLEHNPVDPRIVLSAGHDGHIILWDLTKGTIVKNYYNTIRGQGHGAVFDCKWAPDGQSFVATDSHGYLMNFGFGSNERYQILPEEVFFHTDYRPLIRDANNHVLDEQTQQPPHLMPPPFLVDMDGNPHTPDLQRLVPGREHCKQGQLVPELGVLPSGLQEVLGEQIDQEREREQHRQQQQQQQQQQQEAAAAAAAAAAHVPAPAPGPSAALGPDEDRALIDEMIVRLQAAQDQRILAEGGEPLLSPRNEEAPLDVSHDLQSPRSRDAAAQAIRGPRRGSDRQGVRQSLGHVPVSQRATPRDLANIRRRVVVRELHPSVVCSDEKERHNFAEEEIKKFVLERKRKPLPQSGNESSDSGSYMKTRRKRRHYDFSRPGANDEAGINRLTARALYDTEDETEGTIGTEDLDEDEERVVANGEAANGEADQGDPDHGWKSSSDSDSSEYSDWTADAGVNLQPPKRQSQRQPKRKRYSSSEDSEESDYHATGRHDDDENGDDEEYVDDKQSPKPRKKKPPPGVKKKHRKETVRERQQRKVKTMQQQKLITEVPEEFKLPDWLTGCLPRKTPYFPQMGDEVMYFRQGHEQYLQAVKLRKVYNVELNKNQPWHKVPGLREQELVRLVGLRYEVKPPRLVCLKLALIDSVTGKMTGGSFTIKYHDMADVIDFIVLKQTYDIAMERDWKVGDRFRCLIDDGWWMGTIESQEPFQELYPDSMFQCLNVHWDNGEREKMSPWDLEPVDEKRLPRTKGGCVTVRAEELEAMTYKHKAAEWPPEGRDAECARITRGMDRILELAVAEHFSVPVDLNAFPLYAIIIAYPVDLSLIKSRLENRFYRRVTSIQYDVRHIESNTKVFNEPNSNIVKCARLVTELCLRLISDTDCYDPMPVYNELMKDRNFAVELKSQGPVNTRRGRTGSGPGSGDSASDGDGVGPSTSRKRSRLDPNKSPRRRKVEVLPSPDAWKEECRHLLEIMLESEDSAPFRSPVDPLLYPDYCDLVDSPMDLGTVLEALQCDHYDIPQEICKDVRLVFHNSKVYNTNKKSRIYAMTLRLSAMFEDQFRDILDDWKLAKKYEKSGRLPGKSRKSGPSSSARVLSGGRSRVVAGGRSRQAQISPPNQSTSSSYAAPSTSRSRGFANVNGRDEPGSSEPRPSRAASRGNKRFFRSDDDDDGEEDEEDDDDDDNDDDNDDDESGPSKRSRDTPPETSGPRPRKRMRLRSESESSRESEAKSEAKSDSESDFEVGRARPTGPRGAKTTRKSRRGATAKPTGGKGKLMNGHGARYGTRFSTGSIPRKRYDRVVSDDVRDADRQDSDSSQGDSDADDARHGRVAPSRGAKSKQAQHSLKPGNHRARTRTRTQSQRSESGSQSESGSEADSESESSDEAPPRPKHPSGSEEEEEEEESGSGSEPTRPSRSRVTRSASKTSRRGASTSRIRSRPEEEEEEDDEEEEVSPRSRSNLRPQRVKSSHDSGYRTRNRGRRTVTYQEESDGEAPVRARRESAGEGAAAEEEEEGEEEEEEDEETEDESPLSVSSRGRVRRLTPRARALYS